jgi:ATP-binding cassette subfamily F protein 3
MLQVKNVQKFFGSRTLFDSASMSMIQGERLSLFGRNGSGKSTLLKIITGEESCDNGEVATPKGYRIGYLRQHLEFRCGTVLEEACHSEPGDPPIEEYRAEIILTGLGFSLDALSVAPATLSGGFQIRINLAKLLLSEPNLMLLDEPTNYLDIVSMRWLERFLRQWRGELIIISHDRAFCDAVSTHSAVIYRSGLRKVAGNSEKLFDQLAEEEEQYERTRQNREKTRRDMESFINRFRSKASKASVVQSRVKALAKIGQLDELSDESSLDFSFTYAPFPGRFPIEIDNLFFSYESCPTPLIQGLNFTLKKNDRIAVIGKNGRGKSTLLKLLAGELSPTGGVVTSSPNVKLAYFAQTNINRLHLDWTIDQEIADANPDLLRTQVRNICGAMMFDGNDGTKSIKVLSGGERSRVLLGRILATASNVLLLDEPTNHLDLESVSALTDALEQFEGAALVVTHNEELLQRIATRLIVFQGESPFVFEGGYEQFLSSIGWDGEGDTPSVRPEIQPSEPRAKERDNKRERAELIQERSQVLTPLKKRISTAEKLIADLERTNDQKLLDLAAASTQADGPTIVRLSQELERDKRALDTQMEVWELASEELVRLEAEYEKRIQELGAK